MKNAILNLRTATVMLLLTVAVLLHACDSDDGANTDIVAEQEADDNYPCTRQVEAVLTFWDNVCWSEQIVCDGKQVTVNDREEGTGIIICDIGPESCDAPGVHTFDYTFEYAGGECEYCSYSGEIDVCVPLNETCDKQVVELTASGSEEGGAHPMLCCPDDPDCV